MKHRIHLLLVLFCLGCSLATAQSSATLRLLGADLSMLPAYEKAGVSYKDADGQVQSDPLLFFRDKAGVRCVRVRLFVHPTGETGVIQDLDYVLSYARRIKEAGMSWMLDFHYSDTWADPSQQKLPASWPTDAAGIRQKLYDYTAETLAALKEAGAAPDYIQVGNEISYGMCGLSVHANNDQNWDTFRGYLSAAAKACREQCPQAKIIIHTERAGQWSVARSFYERLATVDYDIIGFSYYPFWHNSLSVLASTLGYCASLFPTKQVMIVETAYNNAWYPTGNGVLDFQSTWPATPAGQQKFVEDLIAELLKHDNVTGLFYWFPEENPYGNRLYEPWVNRGLFNNGYGNEWPNGNRALPAFYSLRKFTEGQPDAIVSLPRSASNRKGQSSADDSAVGRYDLSGRPAAAGHRGLVVTKGHKGIRK